MYTAEDVKRLAAPIVCYPQISPYSTDRRFLSSFQRNNQIPVFPFAPLRSSVLKVKHFTTSSRLINSLRTALFQEYGESL